MMEANEINPTVSENDLTATDEDKEDISTSNQAHKGEKMLKGLTMGVSLIQGDNRNQKILLRGLTMRVNGSSSVLYST